jgi:hypothetical protein
LVVGPDGRDGHHQPQGEEHGKSSEHGGGPPSASWSHSDPNAGIVHQR